MQYTPVMIPTLNRYSHFKRCIESLSHCIGAESTEVYVGLDFPPSEKYVEGYLKIKSYLANCGNLSFKKIHVITRDRNVGAVANWQSLQELLFQKFDVICCSEDDNEFSKNFLVYINEGLEKFKSNPNVFAVCGYNFPIEMSGYDHNYYFSHDMCAWGYATWRDRYDSVVGAVKKPSFLSDYYRDQPLSYFFSHRLRFLNNVNYFGKGFYEDVFVSSYLHSRNMFTVVPAISKIRNWGHDGSGLNSVGSELSSVFSEQIIDSETTFLYDTNVKTTNVPDILSERIDSFFDCGIKTKIKRFMMFVVLRVFLKIQK